MLTADYLDSLASGQLMELYEEFQQSAIDDIARRLVKMGSPTATAAWSMQRLSEAGFVYEDIIKQIADLTGRTDVELIKLFNKAGVKSTTFDNAIYRAAGFDPTPLNLSPMMYNVLMAGINKTAGSMRNLTMTTAISGQEAFIHAADQAYMQVVSGTFDYNTAIRNAVKSVGESGLDVIYQATGKRDKLDVAMRRSVLTGVNQTVGQIKTAQMDEMGIDLVAVSAHMGARNKGTGPANHESWQGKIFSRSGRSKKYPDFVQETGYGTVTGLMGINCRHNYYPFFEGISENAYSEADRNSYANKTVTYQGEEIRFYEATQKQRAIERKIREWKRQASALEAGGLDNTKEVAKVREWQGVMREFIKQVKLSRQYMREQI